MRFIQKDKQEPKCLEYFKADNKIKKPLLYSDLGKSYIQKYTEREKGEKVKSNLLRLDYPFDDLKDVLLKEQGYLCAYCLQRIEKETMKIEHWYPRCLCKNKKNDIDENLKCSCKKQTSKYCSQIDYKNLVAVCEGTTPVDNVLQEHCDTLRGNKFEGIKQLLSINPCKQSDIAKISFSITGKLVVNSNFSMSETDAKKLKDDIEDKLGLNQKHIVENRKSALLSLREYLNKIGWTPSNYKKTLDEYKTLSNGKFKPYNEYIIWYLEKKLRQISS